MRQVFLSADQTDLFDFGHWLGWEVFETVVEDLRRQNICERVVVRDCQGVYAFTVDTEVLR